MAYTQITDIEKILKEYTDDIQESVIKCADEVAEEGARKLKNTLMPSASEMGTSKPFKRRTWSEYSKGWKVKKQRTSNEVLNTIHNSTNYKLTHLLEYGHATRDGKRTRAFKHIEPVESYCVNRFEEEVEKIIKKG